MVVWRIALTERVGSASGWSLVSMVSPTTFWTPPGGRWKEGKRDWGRWSLHSLTQTTQENSWLNSYYNYSQTTHGTSAKICVAWNLAIFEVLPPCSYNCFFIYCFSLDPDPLIPDTGFSDERRKKTSAIFVQPISIAESAYGTRYIGYRATSAYMAI